MSHNVRERLRDGSSNKWRQDNVKQTDLVAPDGNIPVCNRFIPLDSDLIWRQSSAPDPRRGRRTWSLKTIGNKRKKLKWWIATSREQGWRRDGAVVRALASHQCGPGSTPSWCYMWVLLVLPLLRGFFSGFSGFPPSKKTKIFKFQFEQDRGTAWKPAKANAASSLNITIYFIHWITRWKS